jgi:DNA-directed RNA polymerase specialized sigma24 family protein
VGSSKMQPDVLAEISEKLDAILGLLAVRGIEDDVGKSVTRLRGLGLSPKTIARVCGITENAVSIRLTRLKQAETKQKPNTRRTKIDEGAPSPIGNSSGAVAE